MAYYEFGIGPYRFSFALRKYIKAVGVVNHAGEGKYFLIWDFDYVPEEHVIASLVYIQDEYKLSPIYVVKTGLQGGFHAYCFTAFDWADLVTVIMHTPYVDKGFVKLGILRGYFDLRISEKPGRKLQHHCILPSEIPADIDPARYFEQVSYYTPTKKPVSAKPSDLCEKSEHELLERIRRLLEKGGE